MEERHELVPANTRVVGWLRPDETTRIAWMMLGAIPTLLGVLTVGYAYGRIEAADPVGIHRDARAYAVRAGELAPRERGRGEWSGMPFVFLLGLGLVAAGPAIAIGVLRRTWGRDEWLLLRNDALMLQTGAGRCTVRWDDIERISHDIETGEVRFEMRGDEAFDLPPQFTRGDARALALRLEEIRRKATWGLLS